MIRGFVLVLVVAFCGLPAVAQDESAKAEEGLRVLFVGHDPAAPKVIFPQFATERTYALHRERTAAFEALLRYHFKDVRVVYSDDYRVEMSDDVDVTIFDAPPRQQTPAANDPQTGYNPATYLPESFDRPALMIAGTSDRIGSPLGLKLDWL